MVLAKFLLIEPPPQRIGYRAKIHLCAVLDTGELLQRAVRQDALEQLRLDAVDVAHVAEVVDDLLDAEVHQAPRLPPRLHRLPARNNTTTTRYIQELLRFYPFFPLASCKIGRTAHRRGAIQPIDLAPPETKTTNILIGRTRDADRGTDRISKNPP